MLNTTPDHLCIAEASCLPKRRVSIHESELNRNPSPVIMRMKKLTRSTRWLNLSQAEAFSTIFMTPHLLYRSGP